MSSSTHPRSVQSYLDETPRWSDGTQATSAALSGHQMRIWWLACAGKFFEGVVVFMGGIAIPLLTLDWSITAFQKGLVGAAPLFGILIGATFLGGLDDKFGRRPMFIFELFLFSLFTLFVALSPNIWVFILCLFVVGAALGCDYPTANVIISETMPSRIRGKMVLGAFAFQAVGAFAGTVLGYLFLSQNPDASVWRWMYGLLVPIGFLLAALRFSVSETPHFLAARGRMKEAAASLHKLLPHLAGVVTEDNIKKPKKHKHAKKASYGDLFNKKNRRATILASVPWFLQDLGTYGIGIFTPTILATIIGQKSGQHNLAAVIHDDILSAKGAAALDVLLIVGMLAAIFLVERAGRIRLQTLGFLGCALGLLLAALSVKPDGSTNLTLLFAGFMLFNFMTNLGPNAQTYLIAGEVFPTKIRGRGAGFAASFAKIGAVTTAFLFPILLKDIGTVNLLSILVGTSILGAAITVLNGIETKGRSLETLDEEEIPLPGAASGLEPGPAVTATREPAGG